MNGHKAHAKQTSSIGNWTDVLEPVANAQNIPTSRPLRVAKVHLSSPADQAGISAGWEIISVCSLTTKKGQIAEHVAVDENRRMLYPNETFKEILFRDKDDQIRRWTHQNWPFGIILTPPLDMRFMKSVAANVTDRDIMLELWKAGDLDAFVKMKPYLKASLEPQNIFRRIANKTVNRRSPNERYEVWGWLALAEAHDGDAGAAFAAADKAQDCRDALGQASYSFHTLGMEYHARSLAFVLLGEMDQAHDCAAYAYSFCENVEVIRNLYYLLGSEGHSRQQNPIEGKPFAADYVLPHHDPLGEWPTDDTLISLKETLMSLEPQQILPVIVYGGFRSNSYGNASLARLAMVHQVCPNLVGAVHVIVSGTYALDHKHRKWAEQKCRDHGLPVFILYDEEASVRDQLGLTKSPGTFMLSPDGTVLSTLPWADEDGIWAAVARLNANRKLH